MNPKPGSKRRYAIYFLPHPDSNWWRFGCEWLGRDSISDAPRAHPSIEGLDENEITRITAAPRQYGFHATLKAPFRLAPGRSAMDLFQQAAVTASECNVFTLPPLALSVLDGFVALLPGEKVPVLDELAAHCVSAFDPLRAPLSREEIAKRRTARLTKRQGELFNRWGYPFVHDEFRFHLTLTDRLPEPDQIRVLAALAPRIMRLNREPLAIDSFTLLAQEEDAPFVALKRCYFDGTVETYRG